MRLFLTSFQKSGTHQIMPALQIGPDVWDRSHNGLHSAPKKYCTPNINPEGIESTCQQLAEFQDKAFGHVTYLSEFAEAIQVQPTKVLFNVRDPRDVIVSEYFSIRKIYGVGDGGVGWPNLFNCETGKYLIENDDPIRELIELDATRWPNWIGWLQHDFVLKIRYEDLRTDGVAEIHKIAEWLQPYKIRPELCVPRLYPAQSNPTFRKGAIGEWKETFSNEHTKLAERLLGDVITRLGYEI